MKSFSTNKDSSNGIGDSFYFYSFMVLKIEPKRYVNQQREFEKDIFIASVHYIIIL